MRNRIIAASILSYSSSSFAKMKKFPDVPAKHWAEDSIYYLVEKGAVTGNDKGMFEPGKEITRAEAAKFIAKSDSLKIGNPLVEQVIIIDPGHGGTDPGKATQGLHESDIVLDTSKRLQSLLEENTPFRAMLTREKDIRLGEKQGEDLKNRVDFAKEHNEIFL